MSKRTQKRRIRSLFLVLLLTAALLVTSTYAWFSTNRQVSITTINAKVVAAEGLQISLDAQKWSSSVTVNTTNLEAAGQTGSGYNTPYAWPTALEPVSTIGETSGSEVTFKYGMLEANGTDLANITSAQASSPKYIAFDVYLKNSSSQASDELQLDAASFLKIHDPNDTNEEMRGVANTGLENSARVGFNLYDTTKNFTDTVADIKAINGSSRLAIWEPNHDKHIQQIVDQDPRISSAAQNFTTWGLVAAASGNQVNVVNTNAAIENVANAQYAMKTDGELSAPAITLIDQRNASADPIKFTMPGNSISKMRIYIWLEGQDPDCLDIASTGKWFDIGINLRKPDLPTSGG